MWVERRDFERWVPERVWFSRRSGAGFGSGHTGGL